MGLGPQRTKSCRGTKSVKVRASTTFLTSHVTAAQQRQIHSVTSIWLSNGCNRITCSGRAGNQNGTDAQTDRRRRRSLASQDAHLWEKRNSAHSPGWLSGTLGPQTHQPCACAADRRRSYTEGGGRSARKPPLPRENLRLQHLAFNSVPAARTRASHTFSCSACARVCVLRTFSLASLLHIYVA